MLYPSSTTAEEVTIEFSESDLRDVPLGDQSFQETNVERKVAGSDAKDGKMKKSKSIEIKKENLSKSVKKETKSPSSKKENKKANESQTQKSNKAQSKEGEAKKNKKQLSRKQKIKHSFRPQTKKSALLKDPHVLEANWPIVDFLIIAQIIIAFIFLFNAIMIASLGIEGSWSCVLFALQLLITSVPSFILLAKGKIEPAIVVYSILQLLSAFFGYLMVLRYFMSSDSKTSSNDSSKVYSLHIVLWVVIIWQLFTTIFINWVPYRKVDLTKLRGNFGRRDIEASTAIEPPPKNGGNGSSSGASVISTFDVSKSSNLK